MRQNNMRTILSAIKDKGPISKKELQEITKLSWGTVTNLVNALVQKDYVYICDRQGTGAGRKIELFDIDNKKLMVAVSIRNDSFSVILTDLKGRIKSSKTVPYTVMEKDHILSKMAAVIDSLIAAVNGKIEIISFATQGFVDKENGISRKINRIKNWENVNLKSLFEERYQVPVWVEHDINCTLKYETFINPAELADVQNALLISVEDFGIGMAMLVGGNIYNGAHGEAGEIGEILLDDHEQSTFAQLLYNKNEQDPVNLEGILYVAKAGNETAKAYIEKIVSAYGRTLVNVTTVFDPEVVILHGRINESGSLITEGLLREYKKYAFGQQAKVIFSKSDNSAAVNGAALIAGEILIDSSIL